jgi:hypothetical protein
MLHGASIEGRVRHSVGEQLSVLLREEVDAGSMVDTHACLGPLAGGAAHGECETRGVDSAVGFVTGISTDIGPALQVVLHRQARYIGVLPYAGDQRRVSVTWWTSLLNDPLVQQVVLALALVTAVLSAYNALQPLFESKRARPDSRESTTGRASGATTGSVTGATTHAATHATTHSPTHATTHATAILAAHAGAAARDESGGAGESPGESR